jgi:hypothetical protein
VGHRPPRKLAGPPPASFPLALSPNSAEAKTAI